MKYPLNPHLTRRLERRRPVRGRERCPACHPERSTVILSAAKDLSAHRARPCAEFTLSEANGLRDDRHSLQMSIASASEMQQVAWTLSGLLAATASDFCTGFRCRDRHLDIVVLLHLVDDG